VQEEGAFMFPPPVVFGSLGRKALTKSSPMGRKSNVTRLSPVVINARERALNAPAIIGR
jgi:hypothetical protein